MPIDKVEAQSAEERPRKRQRLRLIESYGAFSDDRLREVTEKIRDVTSSQPSQAVPIDIQPDTPSGESSARANINERDTPIRSSIDTSNESPDETPDQQFRESPLWIVD